MPEETGLTSSKAKELLKQYGKNELPETPLPGNFEIFLSQIKSPLVYILLVAAVITFFLKEYSDTIIIFVAVFINTILEIAQIVNPIKK